MTGLAWTDVLKLVDVTWRGGLIKGQKLFDFFRENFEDRDLTALGADVVIAVDLGWAKLGRYRTRRSEAREIRMPERIERISWLARLVGEVSAEEERESAPSILQAFLAAIDIMQVRLARSRLAGEPAEVLLTPLLPDFATMDFHRAAEAIEEGREAVARARPMLDLMTEV